jgi:homoserine O-acetyltransferase/O-succinyltransferase
MECVESKFIQISSAEDPLRLASGACLRDVTVAYETYGELNHAKDNAILVFHALSGSQHAAGTNATLAAAGPDGRFWTSECHSGWWSDFIGKGKALDTDRFYVICANFLGGCYGTTGPSSLNPESGLPYASGFPSIAIRDIVDSQARLLDALGIQCLHAVVGGSMGGMACLGFATRYPSRVQVVIPLATSLYATTLHRIHNFEQIYAIESDPDFHGGDYYGGAYPVKGLGLARMIAHKTYVSLHTMEDRARDEIVQPSNVFKHYQFSHPIESYMLHQGTKFVSRFDANTYLRLCEAWLRFDLLKEAGCGDYQALFSPCAHQKYMIFSVDSDVCFYPEEQVYMARTLKRSGIHSRHITIHSEKGHDAFLLEPALLEPHLRHSLENPW